MNVLDYVQRAKGFIIVHGIAQLSVGRLPKLWRGVPSDPGGIAMGSILQDDLGSSVWQSVSMPRANEKVYSGKSMNEAYTPRRTY